MVVDIHKIITVSKNLLKPWGVNAKKGSIRSKFFRITSDQVIVLIGVKRFKSSRFRSKYGRNH